MREFQVRPTEAHTHYRCVFDIRRAFISEDDRTHLLKEMRRWISQKEARARTDAAFGGSWFFVGGEWVPDRGRYPKVFTASESGPDGPHAWALRYEHLDNLLPERVWTTDVGVEPHPDGQFRVSIRLTHSLRPTFVGKEPPLPSPSAPRVVSHLLQSANWVATSGSVSLRCAPHALEVGRGHLFARSVFDTGRGCPVVYASCDRSSGRPLIDVTRVSRLLAGNADVLYAASSEVDEELALLLPNSLRCTGGMIRVYFPGATEREANVHGRPHRYFSRAQILGEGPDEIERQIVAALCRRVPPQLTVDVETLGDVEYRNREHRLKQLAAGAQDDLHLELALYREEHEKLVPLRGRVRDMQDQIEQLTIELEQERAETKYERQELLSQAQLARERADQLEVGLSRLRAMPPPSSLDEMLDWIEAIYPTTIEFTKEARASAREASINQQKHALKDMWEVLQSTASVLPRLAFEDTTTNGDLTSAFRNETGWELTLSESSMTRHDAALMNARQIDYGGQKIDISPHIKFGTRPPACARIHFYLDRERRMVIVGHCGDHLETAGTKRRR